MNINQTTWRKNPEDLDFQFLNTLQDKIGERNIFGDLLF
jgi:hypothetical protein